jgi:hypothetical protein
MDKAITESDLVTAYFSYLKTKDDDLFWAWERIDEIAHADPVRAWALILQLIVAAPDDLALFRIAAGPLEVLLKSHGPVVIDRVEDQARKDPRFRFVLSGVWGHSEIFDRVHRAAGAGSNYPLERTRS